MHTYIQTHNICVYNTFEETSSLLRSLVQLTFASIIHFIELIWFLKFMRFSFEADLYFFGYFLFTFLFCYFFLLSTFASSYSDFMVLLVFGEYFVVVFIFRFPLFSIYLTFSFFIYFSFFPSPTYLIITSSHSSCCSKIEAKFSVNFYLFCVRVSKRKSDKWSICCNNILYILTIFTLILCIGEKKKRKKNLISLVLYQV